MNIAEYHQKLNDAFRRNISATQLYGDIVKANVSNQRAFVEVASDGHRLQCGMSLPPGVDVSFKKGERLELYARYPPKIWRNGSVGLWVPWHDVTLAVSDENKLETQRQEALELLRSHKLLDKNKQHTLRTCRRILLITAEKSDACADFQDELRRGVPEVHWDVTVVDTLVQGQECYTSMQKAFAKVDANTVDVVVVTRGGGSPQDLAAFEDVRLASLIATCPVPVLTGIGHHRDESLCDAVAYRSFKTPTAVATHLVQRVRLLCEPVQRHLTYIHTCVARAVQQRRMRLEKLQAKVRRYVDAWPLARRLRVAEYMARVQQCVQASRAKRVLTCRLYTLEDNILVASKEKLDACENQRVRILIGDMVIEGVCRRQPSSS